MASPVHTIKPSFSGGEFAPSLWARTDIQKYATGARTLRNFYVHPHGGISNRPGLHYVATTKLDNSKVRVIDFQFASDENYVIEFGDEYNRFYTNDAQVYSSGTTPYEITSIYNEDDLASIRYSQSADVMFIAHPDYQPRELQRLGNATWQYVAYAFTDGPFRLANSDSTLTMRVSSKTGNVTLTASAAFFYSTHASSVYNSGALMLLNHYIDGQSISQTFIATGTSTYIPCGGTWRIISHGTWKGTFKVEKSDDASTWTVLRQFSSNSDFNVDTYGSEDMSDGALPFYVRANMQAYTSGSCSIDLTTDPYTHQGVARIDKYVSSTQVVVNMQRATGSTVTTSDWAEGAWSDYRGWPSGVCFAQDRLVWAGTLYDPQTLFMTQTGNYYSFWRNNPLVDSDGITVNLPSQKLNQVNGLVPLLQLLVFTSGGEWSMGSSQNNILSPTSMQTRLNGYTGSSGVQPCVIVNRAIYIQSRGCVVRDLGYDLFTDTFTGANLSILSNHLFTNYNIVEMAYQQDPDSLVWAVRDDGKLLCMTYMREQEVLAWTWCDTYEGDDLFESICSIPGDGYNEVWVVVNRDGQRMIERFDQRMKSSLKKDQFFVDSGVIFDSSSTLDTYTKLLMHMDGTDGTTGFTDEKGNTVTNTASYDSYTKLMLHGDGNDNAGQNQTFNWNFELWLAGATATPSGWSLAGAAAAVAANTTTIRNGYYSAKLTAGGGAAAELAQSVQTWYGIDYWKGKTVRFDCFIYSATASYGTVAIDDGVSTTTSTCTTFNAWELVSVTKTIAATATQVRLELGVNTASKTCYFDRAIAYEVITDSIGKSVYQGDIVGTTYADSYTKALAHFNGPQGTLGYTDDVRDLNYGFVGGATISTANYKFGWSSLFLTAAATSSLALANSADWYFGTGDFSIEAWINLTDTLTNQCIFYNGAYSGSYGQQYFRVTNTGQLDYLFQSTDSNNVGVTSIPTTWTYGVWYHIAITRASQTYSIFKDGVSLPYVKSLTGSVNYGTTFTTNLYLGYFDSGTDAWFNGYLDEYRISKGIARWQASLLNPGFESWSAGTSVAPDGWTLEGAGAAVARNSGASYVKEGTYSAGLGRNGANCYLYQAFHSAKGIGYWKGRAVTVGCWVKCNTATRARIKYADDAASSYSDYHTGGDTWQWLTATGTVNGGTTAAYIYCCIEGATDADAYFDGVTITVDGVNINNVFTPSSYQYGEVVVSDDQSKFGGESLYFDGAGSHLSLADSADWTFAAGDFTIDCWVKWTDKTGGQSICGQYQASAEEWLFVKTSADKLQFYTYSGATDRGQFITTNAVSISNDTWYHISVVRSGTSCLMFLNGVSQAVTETTAWGTAGDLTGVLRVGKDGGGASFFNGYIDELRISKGIARWTENFTPPHTPYGQVYIDNNASKFGGEAGLFDGAGSYLSVPDSADWNFGTGDFTIDFWVRFNSLSGNQGICGQYVDANNNWWIIKDQYNQIIIWFKYGGNVKGYYYFASSPMVDTWYHIAVVRNGTTAKIFWNGVSQTLTESTAFGTNDLGDLASTLSIGYDQFNAAYLNGYIDELRISKGIARWTSNFTPYSSAYTVYGEPSKVIVGLQHLEGRTVACLADGNVKNQQAVSNGTITLTDAYSYVVTGLPYFSDMETLNIDMGLSDGSLQGRRIHISRVILRILDSRGGWLGPDEDNLHELLGDYDTSTDSSLFTGDVKINLGQGYKDGGRFFFRQIDPLPITILGVMPIITAGGTTLVD